MIRLFFIFSLVFVGCSSYRKNMESSKVSDQRTIATEKPLSCLHTEKVLKCAEYVKNYDGDTITFNIPGLHPLIGKNISIRVLGVDTPEIRTKNFCEKKKAVVAKKKVYDMLKKARNIELHNIKRGKYFRIVSDVIVDGKSIGKELIKSRLAYPYYGGSKKNINWCF